MWGKEIAVAEGGVGRVHAAEGEAGVLQADGAEEGGAEEVGILTGDGHVAQFGMESAQQGGREGGVEGEARGEGPEVSRLLPRAEGVGLGPQLVEPRGRTGAIRHAQTHGAVAQRLHAQIGYVLLSAPVLDEHSDGGLPLKGTRFVAIPQEGGVRAHGEGLLMRVEVEDVALPVEPEVEVDARSVEQELETHFGVGREVLLGVVEGQDELVVLCPVDVAQHDGEVTEIGLRTQVGQGMDAVLVLVALPRRDVVVGIVGVAVCPVEEHEMGTHFEANLRYRVAGEFRLQPRPRQGVALHHLRTVLVVLEEGQGVHLSPQCAHVGGADAVTVDAERVPHLGVER